tara:strand:- start:38 stop:214 length:177 start_codon:yes stop_codon:yes gene_type:complete
MEDIKIDKALEYYKERKEEILAFVNKTTNLNAHMVISKGQELSDIDAKISALEIAKNN